MIPLSSISSHGLLSTNSFQISETSVGLAIYYGNLKTRFFLNHRALWMQQLLDFLHILLLGFLSMLLGNHIICQRESYQRKRYSYIAFCKSGTQGSLSWQWLFITIITLQEVFYPNSQQNTTVRIN